MWNSSSRLVQRVPFVARARSADEACASRAWNSLRARCISSWISRGDGTDSVMASIPLRTLIATQYAGRPGFVTPGRSAQRSSGRAHLLGFVLVGAVESGPGFRGCALLRFGGAPLCHDLPQLTPFHCTIYCTVVSRDNTRPHLPVLAGGAGAHPAAEPRHILVRGALCSGTTHSSSV